MKKTMMTLLALLVAAPAFALDGSSAKDVLDQLSDAERVEVVSAVKTIDFYSQANNAKIGGAFQKRAAAIKALNAAIQNAQKEINKQNYVVRNTVNYVYADELAEAKSTMTATIKAHNANNAAQVNQLIQGYVSAIHQAGE